MTPGDPDSTALAVTVLLQRKGRVIDAAADMQAALRRHADAESLALLDQLNDVVGQLARLVLNGPQKTPVDEYRNSIAALEERKEQLESQIGRRSAEFRAASVPVTLEAVQAAIPANAALIEFAAYRPFDPAIESVDAAFGKLRYAAYVVHRTGPPSAVDLGDAATIDKAVEALRAALGDPARSDVRRLSRALDDAVMRPLRGLVARQHPSADLAGRRAQPHSVRGAARRARPVSGPALSLHLPDERARPAAHAGGARGSARTAHRGESGIRRTDRGFSRADCGSIGRTRERRRSVTSARDLSEVYFAPIDGTAREAQAIRRLFPDATVLAGERATESSLRQFAAPRLLHIATHGFFLQYAGVAPKAGAPERAVVPAGIRCCGPGWRSRARTSAAEPSRTTAC